MTTLIHVDPEATRPLMERTLRSGAPLAQDYPLVFQDGFPGGVVALGEGSDVHSACAILTRDFVTPQGAVRVGLIGSVSTDPGRQGQGLATRVLIEAEAELEKRGCHLALLWADDPRFYYARAYRPLGCELHLTVPRSMAGSLPAAEGVRELRDDDTPAVHSLYLRHASHVARRCEETHALLACPGMSTLVLESEGRVVAYACLGRGADLADTVHEWAGAEGHVLALVRAHLDRAAEREQPAERIFVTAPTTAEGVASRLIDAGAEARAGVLGIGKILSYENCVELFASLLGDEGSAELRRTEKGKRLAIRTPRGEAVLDDDLLLALLFPAFGLTEEVEDFRAAYGLSSAAFPMELYAWGLDSI
ncbi:MAG: GNAT family N-acetyltransferase [Planctomycetota bacterium]